MNAGFAYAAWKEGKLNTRTLYSLYRLNLTRKTDILRAIKDGTLSPSNPKALGFGAKGLAQLCDLLGLRREMTVKQRYKIRCELAVHLRAKGHTLAEISSILRLRSKEEARKHVARGDYLAKIHNSQFFSPSV